MQGPPGAQRQEELERTGDAIQIAQWLEVLGGRGERESSSVRPAGPAGPHRPCLLWQVVSPTRTCPSPNPLYLGCALSWKWGLCRCNKKGILDWGALNPVTDVFR